MAILVMFTFPKFKMRFVEIKDTMSKSIKD